MKRQLSITQHIKVLSGGILCSTILISGCQAAPVSSADLKACANKGTKSCMVTFKKAQDYCSNLMSQGKDGKEKAESSDVCKTLIQVEWGE
ncbi:MULTISPECIES: hypothetical protein [Cysteiniphilum]|uniref:Lipoprotein n=1 Tax=Cysteiniphilum litorale TaxID=2056700 RepID=A0A8J2Z3H2_9GAMM|nr:MULTISPECIES: hypothetical protein [Cysteiniphilum]GGF93695.1 hypothetical protein GCM10010995_08600 [Cysteiniphilum litorale]